MKTIYLYSPNTKEYLGTDICFISPLEGIYRLPENSTEIKPPEFGEYEKPIWENNQWVIVKDYRAKELYDENGNKITLKLGENLPSNYSEIPKPITAPPFDYELVNGSWNLVIKDNDLAISVIKRIRTTILNLIDFIGIRYNEEKIANIPTFISEQQFISYINFKQILRDIPETLKTIEISQDIEFLLDNKIRTSIDEINNIIKHLRKDKL